MKTPSLRAGLSSGSIIASLALAAAFAPVVNATTVSLTPAMQNVIVGNAFDLAVRITGLGDHTAPSLGAFDLDLSFNSILAQYDSITFGDPSFGDYLGASINGSSLSLSGDSVNLFSISLENAADLDLAQPAGFTLATLHFTALTAGSGSFDVVNVILGDANGDALSLDATQGASITLRSQDPQGVPEGGVGWMGAFTVGALAVGHLRLSRRQRSY